MMKKKVLFITAYVPHKAAAGEKNTMLMLNELAETFDVDLIYFKYDYDNPYLPEKENVRVRKIFKNANWIKIWGIVNLPLLHPVYSIRFSWRKLFLIKRLTQKENYSAIFLNHSNVFVYGKFLNPHTPKLLFAHDVIIQRALRSSSKIVQQICRFSEGSCFRLPNAHIFSFSQKDVDLIAREYNLPAKVCLDYIDPKIIAKTIEKLENYYVFFGDWTRKENYEGVVWFFKEVAPSIKKEIFIKIIGRKFPEEKLNNNNPNIHVEILGFVDDPYKLISEAKALITPLFHGAGIKVKVIEALACGTPVIGTDIAFEGLPDKYSRMMLLANDIDSYLKAMEVDIPLEERLRMKKAFIEDYTSETIPQFLIKLLK